MEREAEKIPTIDVSEIEKINNEIKGKCFLMGDKLYGIALYERDIEKLKSDVSDLIAKRRELEKGAQNGSEDPK